MSIRHHPIESNETNLIKMISLFISEFGLFNVWCAVEFIGQPAPLFRPPRSDWLSRRISLDVWRFLKTLALERIDCEAPTLRHRWGIQTNSQLSPYSSLGERDSSTGVWRPDARPERSVKLQKSIADLEALRRLPYGDPEGHLIEAFLLFDHYSVSCV